MYRFLMFAMIFMLNACATEYVFVDDTEVVEVSDNSNEQYYVESVQSDEGAEFSIAEEGRLITANDVFVVGEGNDFVTYQYKNVRVDEISPLATMYCADVAFGGSPYLREVSLYHNGFMRATFDCVSLAI
ncbi:MAG: hypothetical protein E7005_03235 [Alphaproteobacteria bacterium]|nr:hypothetical protein [Alphaproteobacteria bacterium]